MPGSEALCGSTTQSGYGTRVSVCARHARVVCAVSVTELDERRAAVESKSLGELRAMARQYNVRGTQEPSSSSSSCKQLNERAYPCHIQ